MAPAANTPKNFPRKASFGHQIRWTRRHFRISHDRLGAASGVTRQHLIRLERDLHKPKPDTAQRIVGALSGMTGIPRELFNVPADDDEDSRDMSVILFARINGREYPVGQITEVVA